VLGDLLAHHAHRHDVNLLTWFEDWSRRRRSGRPGTSLPQLDVTKNVLLGNAAAEARSVDLGQIDLVLLGDPAHERRGLLTPQIFGRVRRTFL
jgi:hypothetical protein